MEKFDIIIKNGRVVIPTVGIVEADIAVKGGRIAGMFEKGKALTAEKEIDAKDKYILPGGIDPHLHPGVPKGITHFEETFGPETASCAIGGITTPIMYASYYGEPPKAYEDFPEIIKKAESKAHVDFAIHLMIRNANQSQYLEKYVKEYGVKSFKYSFGYKKEASATLMGIRNEMDDGIFYDNLERLGKLGGVAAIHCENDEVISQFETRFKNRNDLAAHTEARPDFCEAETTHRACYFAEVAGCPLYVVHVTCKAALMEIIRHKQSRKGQIYAETCIQYLTHTKDDPVGILAKVNPPLRDREDIDALWKGLADGDIDTVGTDHVGGIRKVHKKDLWTARSGFPGVALMLPVLLSEGVNKGRLSLERVAEVYSCNAAKIFGLYPRKGTIQIGSDADFSIVDLSLERKVNHEMLGTLSDFSIWDGWTLKGWPVLTILRGRIVMENGKVVGPEGFGRYIPRK